MYIYKVCLLYMLISYFTLFMLKRPRIRKTSVCQNPHKTSRTWGLSASSKASDPDIGSYIHYVDSSVSNLIPSNNGILATLTLSIKRR